MQMLKGNGQVWLDAAVFDQFQLMLFRDPSNEGRAMRKTFIESLKLRETGQLPV